MSRDGYPVEHESGYIHMGTNSPTQENVLAVNPLTFDSGKQLAQALIDHEDRIETVQAAHEPPKESGGKMKF